MEQEYINLTPENIGAEHLCCIIRSRKPHPGVEAKRAWLAERLQEGHVFRKRNEKGCCFIEYSPVEQAWVPVEGAGYLYIYCLWATGEFKGKGCGRELMEYCLADARERGASGVCMLGAKRQKNWLSSQNFAKKYGFEVVDETADGYQLLALSLDGTRPRFTDRAREQKTDRQELTIYYSMQCPFVLRKIEDIRTFTEENGIPAALIPVETLEQAKALPGMFNNWGVFYRGKFETVNLLDVPSVKKILSKTE